MIYKAFDKQIGFHRSDARIRGAFAGKRCISPESKVLSLDGVKSFGDISDKDRLLSFDQRANRFRFSGTGFSFPKTKETGYRVIHDRGEFVSSAHHRALLSGGEYVSVEEIYRSFLCASNGQEVSFLSHDHSTEALARSLFPLSGLSLTQKLSGFLDGCGTCIHQYGQRLLSSLNSVPTLFQPSPYAQGSHRNVFYYLSSAHQGDLSRMKLECSHPYPSFCQSSNLDEEDLSRSLSVFSQKHAVNERIFSQFHHLNRVSHPLSGRFDAFYKEPGSVGLHLEMEKVCASHSRILAIEPVSKQWFWDVEVPGDNNYVSGGVVHHNSGKTECGAIESIIYTETKKGWKQSNVDQYAGAIIAPTSDMLRRLSLKKFLAYAKPFEFQHHQTFNELSWHNGSMVYGISGEKPSRLEGLKLNWIWIDEVFQCSEQLFLECRARVADQEGDIWVTGSLGVQYQNPRRHWVYKYFKEKPSDKTETFEWATADNPYFPQQELADLRDTLDPRTFRQMFTIDWNTPGSSLVYDEFSDLNYVRGFVPQPGKHEVSVSIDWGWNHELACLFIAYEPATGIITVFDEIVSSRLKLEDLYAKIMAKQYPVKNWYCDIAGNQEREQTGKSNVQWFREKGIQMRYRQTAINFGVSLFRTFIKSGSGQIKFYIDETRCPKMIDGMLNYSYPTKDGQIVNENPLKVADDCVDCARYYIVNRHDPAFQQAEVKQFNRWGEWKF